MKSACLTGRSVYLRPLERSDLGADYLSWLNDPEVNRFIEAGRFPQNQASLERFFDGLVGSTTDVIFAIATKADDQHIGNIKLGRIHWIHRTGELGLMIGEKSAWGKGHGYDATDLLLAYAFRSLNLQKVTLGVHATNTAAVKVYEKAGFVIEGRHRRQSFVDGQYLDGLSMGILREDWERKQESKSDTGAR